MGGYPRISTPGHGQEPHGIQSASTGPVAVPWVSNLCTPALPPSHVGHNPHTSHKNPHSVDDYVFRNTKQRGEGEGVRGCEGQNLHPACL